MRTHRWYVVAPLAALVLLVGACTSDGDAQADDGIEPIGSDGPAGTEIVDAPEPQPEPEPEAQPEPEPEPEDEPEPSPASDEIDITVVPDEITEDYVEAVLVELEHIYAEAYAIVRDEQELTIEITNRVGSIFAESRIDDRYGEFQQLAETPEVFRPKGELTPRVRQVVEILDSSDQCLWLETLTDSSGLSAAEGEGVVFIALFRKDVERPVDLNPTPWVFERLRVPVEVGSDEDAREDSPCSAQ